MTTAYTLTKLVGFYLAGSSNADLLRKAADWLEEKKEPVTLLAISPCDTDDEEQPYGLTIIVER